MVSYGQRTKTRKGAAQKVEEAQVEAKRVVGTVGQATVAREAGMTATRVAEAATNLAGRQKQ